MSKFEVIRLNKQKSLRYTKALKMSDFEFSDFGTQTRRHWDEDSRNFSAKNNVKHGSYRAKTP